MELFLWTLHELSVDEAERLMVVVWEIWRHRNEVVWEGKASTPAQVVFALTGFMVKWK